MSLLRTNREGDSMPDPVSLFAFFALSGEWHIWLLDCCAESLVGLHFSVSVLFSHFYVVQTWDLSRSIHAFSRVIAVRPPGWLARMSSFFLAYFPAMPTGHKVLPD